MALRTSCAVPHVKNMGRVAENVGALVHVSMALEARRVSIERHGEMMT